MRVDISFKYMESNEFVDSVLENNFNRLQRHLKMLRSNSPVHISVHIEKNPHRQEYFCRAHIYLPRSKVLAATEKGNSAILAINKAFAALIRQVERIKERSKSRRKKARRNSLT